VHGRWGAIWPNLDDMRHFIQMLRLNFGLSKEHLQFGRYTFEEKMEYWALVWGGVVMIATGFIQWFPTFITRWLPGAVIPIARAFHGWEAILAVLAILTWHTYHAVLKHFNKSIFTGYLTEEEMREEHPAELAHLERAAASLQRPPPSQPHPRPAATPQETPSKSTEIPLPDTSSSGGGGGE
jgi:cytochrome b subunit of formate dehydrogenase